MNEKSKEVSPFRESDHVEYFEIALLEALETEEEIALLLFFYFFYFFSEDHFLAYIKEKIRAKQRIHFYSLVLGPSCGNHTSQHRRLGITLFQEMYLEIGDFEFERFVFFPM